MVANVPGLKRASGTGLRRTPLDPYTRDLGTLHAPVRELGLAGGGEHQVELAPPRPPQRQLDSHSLRYRDSCAASQAAAGEADARCDVRRCHIGMSALRAVASVTVDPYVDGLPRVDEAVGLRAVGDPQQSARAQRDEVEREVGSLLHHP